MVEDLTVRDVMTREYIGVSESDTVQETADLLREDDQSAIAVLHGSDPVGMVLERHLLSAYVDGRDPNETRMDAIMHPSPPSVRPDRSLGEAAAILADVPGDHILVLDGDELIGILSEGDLLRALVTTLETDPNADEVGVRMDVTPDTATSTLSDQSVCELCGEFKRGLQSIDGQLLCSDCRVM